MPNREVKILKIMGSPTQEKCDITFPLFNRHFTSMKSAGITLIELLVVIAIVAILATAAMPLSRMTVKRTKEIELRSSLRILRKAIDEFKADCDNKNFPRRGLLQTDRNNYPESLEQLTEPLKWPGPSTRHGSISAGSHGTHDGA
jgi:prepilin-type N-terminal cleavage/methylation domain-containing protein